MKSLFILLLILIAPYPLFAKAGQPTGAISAVSKTQNNKKLNARRLYREMKLGNKISYAAFSEAIAGYNRLALKNKAIITLIDFSKPSTEERFFVLDIQRKKVLVSSVVSHGMNSGENYASSFSNLDGSHKSSLGFYITENTYRGRNGYSLVLDGLERGINDNAKERAIVIHGAAYADPATIQSNGRLGRSFGCPALPVAISKKVIDTIKNGSLLFIYGNDANYRQHSKLIPKNAV